MRAGQPVIERAPGRKPDLLAAMGHDRVNELAKLLGFDAPKRRCDSRGEPTGAELKQADAAIQLEHLWDEIAKTCDVDILCGYVLNSCQRERESHIYERICAEHSGVCFL